MDTIQRKIRARKLVKWTIIIVAMVFAFIKWPVEATVVSLVMLLIVLFTLAVSASND